jgi:hypothetical protein
MPQLQKTDKRLFYATANGVGGIMSRKGAKGAKKKKKKSVFIASFAPLRETVLED